MANPKSKARSKAKETEAKARETTRAIDEEKDSNLQTDQPDKPVRAETQEEQRPQEQDDNGGESDEPRKDTSEPEPIEETPDQGEQQPERPQQRLDAAEWQAKKEAELHAERVRHNERTGGGDVREGEIQEALEKHNERARTRFDVLVEA